MASTSSRILLTRLAQNSKQPLMRGSERLAARFNTAPLYNLQSNRSMVMITKTAAGEVPLEVVEPVVQLSSSDNSNSVVTEDLAITDSCFKRIESLASKRGSLDELYLRVYVDAGGCSGFQYKFELTLDKDEAVDLEGEDICYTDADSGARVVIDQSSLDLLRGSKIDFVQEMIKSSFAVVDNPQSESACGCGSSFAVKNFTSNPALD
jgi:iron-sulfur cluster assembly accessory protein